MYTVLATSPALLISRFLSSFLISSVLGWRKCLGLQGIITGRFSRDLVQGGLEVPCILVFEAKADSIGKVRKLFDHSEKQISETEVVC